MQSRALPVLLAASLLTLHARPAGAQAPASPDAGSPADFGSELLRLRGLPPSIGTYFNQQPRFGAGWQPVQVTVNGTSLGKLDALFDEGGDLCFPPDFLKQAGLQAMDGDGAPPTGGACPDYRLFAPRTSVQLRPATGEVEIILPAQYRRPTQQAARAVSGGIGGLFNYRGYAMEFGGDSSGGPRSRVRYLDSTAGINANDWLVRSRQDYSSDGADGHMRWRGAFAQKTLESRKQVMQFGLLTSQDPLFGGLPLVGAQAFPERSLSNGMGYTVTGVAASRARVRIEQRGMLLLDTVVPAGPFSLSDYQLLDRNSDLQVQVQDDGGGVQAFTVPSTALMLAASNAQLEGWTAAAGALRSFGGTGLQTSGTGLALGSRGWARDGHSGVASALAATDFLSVGSAVNVRIDALQSQLRGQLLASHGPSGSGLLGSVALGRSLGDWQVGLSGNTRSAGYRVVQDAAAKGGLQQTQVGALVGWNGGAVGTLSMSVTRDTSAGDALPSGNTVNLAWSKGFRGGVSLNLGLTRREVQNIPLPAGATNQARGSSLYASLNWPLGTSASMRAEVQRHDGAQRQIVSMEHRVSPLLGYRASIDRAAGDAASGRSLSVYGMPYFASLSAGVSRQGSSQTLYAEASGSAVLTADGLALAPYAVQDSFGIARTGNLGGIRIETPMGPVWSGPNGLAAVPVLPPYLDSRIEVDGKSVGRNVEVGAGLKVVQAGRGAVLSLDMEVQRVRRWMVSIRLADGSPLAAGSAILLNGTELVTVADDDGRGLITSKDESDRWWAELPDGARCALGEIEVSTSQPEDFFTRASAQCR